MLCLENKLNGRLTMLAETGRRNSDLVQADIAKAYGRRIAHLVAEGNPDATALVALSEELDHYRDRRTANLDVLAEYGRFIAHYRSKLNLPSGAGPEIAEMLLLASGGGYDSPKQFRDNLCEGLILNVNTLASGVLAIPPGDYVVWTTDAGRTVLVPTNEARENREVLADPGQKVEVYTRDLVGCWNKIGRVIGERTRHRQEKRLYKTDTSGEGGKAREPRVTKAHEGLPNLRRAREQAGLSLTDFAERAGVGISTAAKWELGYANPLQGSMEKAMDAIEVEPDVFFKPGPVEPYSHLGDQDQQQRITRQQEKEQSAEKED